jgi:hypothetical protein
MSMLVTVWRVMKNRRFAGPCEGATSTFSMSDRIEGRASAGMVECRAPAACCCQLVWEGGGGLDGGWDES